MYGQNCAGLNRNKLPCKQTKTSKHDDSWYCKAHKNQAQWNSTINVGHLEESGDYTSGDDDLILHSIAQLNILYVWDKNIIYHLKSCENSVYRFKFFLNFYKMP